MGRVQANFNAVTTLQITMGTNVASTSVPAVQDRQFGSVFTAIAITNPVTTFAPVADLLTTVDNTPLLTGTVGTTVLGADDFSVKVNGITYYIATSPSYVPGSVAVNVVGTTWSLDVPTPLAAGVYEVTAARAFAGGGLIVPDQS